MGERSYRARIGKNILISKYFGVALDALIMGNDNRVVEEMGKAHAIKPQYQNINDWEFYSSNLTVELQQSIEEGLDVESYADVFSVVSRLPKGEIKKKLGDVLFNVVVSAKQKDDYGYNEPSEFEKIKSLRKDFNVSLSYDESTLQDKISGVWMGRICGCMLGKTVEGIRSDELIPFLREIDNYPMHRYILKSDLAKVNVDKFKYGFVGRCYADDVDGMPVDDDTNYVILAQEIISNYGRDFAPYDVASAWLKYQGKDAYCTAERVAYCNFVNGFAPPESAVYKNPYREWIGAQIREDYFGYINPGNPELAAEMAWRDASISRVKNGIYGEMFVSAMLVVAALLYGGGDYGKFVCMAVETGFDTDCNGATVGSVIGMANGIASIPDCWLKPLNDTLYTSIFGFDKVKISERIKLTMEHIG